MKNAKRKGAVAPLGNFVVVKVALRITDARQEVGIAEAARGARSGGVAELREQGNPPLHCGSERASEIKKRHYSIMRTNGALVTHLHGCYYPLPCPPPPFYHPQLGRKRRYLRYLLTCSDRRDSSENPTYVVRTYIYLFEYINKNRGRIRIPRFGDSIVPTNHWLQPGCS